MNLFGKAKKKDQAPEAMAQLKESLEALTKRATYLEQKMEKEKKLAIEYNKKGPNGKKSKYTLNFCVQVEHIVTSL